MACDEGPSRPDALPAGPVPPATRVERIEPAGTAGWPPHSEPLVEAIGLGKYGPRGWVYHDVDLAVPAGGVAAVVGGKGSGRTSLLLTIAGRMRRTEGELRVAGFALPRRSRRVRRRVSVARIGGAVDLEGRLTVRQTFLERRSLDAVRADRAESAFDDACQLIGFDADPDVLVEELPVVDRTRLALAVALIADPVLVVLDDLDAGLHTYEQRGLWQRARAVGGTGVAVVASTADAAPAYGLVDAVVSLRRPTGDTFSEVASPRRGAPRADARAGEDNGEGGQARDL